MPTRIEFVSRPNARVRDLGVRIANVSDRFLLYALFSLLLLGTLANATHQDWPEFALLAAPAGLLLLWCMNQIRSGKLHLKHNPLYLPILSFGFLILFQIIFHRSAYRYDTFSAGLRYFTYGVFFFLTVQCLKTVKEAELFFTLSACFGGALAFFTLVQGVMPSAPGAQVFHGPYVNHSLYAGLMEMLTPFPLVASLRREIRIEWRALYAFAAILMAVSIFFSKSRGGMVAFLIQAVFVTVYLVTRSKTHTPGLLSLGVSALILIMVVALGGGKLLESLGNLQDATRLTIVKDSLRMVRDRPIAGWGLGTFSTVYPQYKSFYTDYLINEAHNDYVQVLVETGLIGLAITIWFLFVLYRSSLRGMRQPEDGRPIALAALVGCTGIVVHSLTDFNMQVTSNASLFYVLCALATTELQFTGHITKLHRRSVLSSPPRGIV